MSLPKRRNCDGYINQHGHDILEKCKSLDLRILNERTKGDTLGKTTFHGNRGVSTVDYVITNSDMYDRVDSFTVCQPTPFSDHSPVKGWFNISPPTNNSFPEMTGIELNENFQNNFNGTPYPVRDLSTYGVRKTFKKLSKTSTRNTSFHMIKKSFTMSYPDLTI